MKLKIDVFDVEISTGRFYHSDSEIMLKFRRSPDSDVVSDIFSLTSEYGWKVIDYRGKDNAKNPLEGDIDFKINCVGASSIEVGNAMAEHFETKHGLKSRKIQRLNYGKSNSMSSLFIVKQFHDRDIVLHDDVKQ